MRRPRHYVAELMQIKSGGERERRLEADVPDNYKPLVRKYLEIQEEWILYRRRTRPQIEQEAPDDEPRDRQTSLLG